MIQQRAQQHKDWVEGRISNDEYIDYLERLVDSIIEECAVAAQTSVPFEADSPTHEGAELAAQAIRAMKGG